MSDPKHPEFGAMSIDATDVTPVVVTPAEIRRFSKTRSGFEKALTCLGRLTPEQATILGISAADVAEAKAIEPELTRAAELVPPVVELGRRLGNVRLFQGHRAATLVHSAAATARKRANRDPKAAEVLGAVGELVSYTRAPTEKARTTLAKKGKGKKAPPAPASGTGTGNGPAPGTGTGTGNGRAPA